MIGPKMLALLYGFDLPPEKPKEERVIDQMEAIIAKARNKLCYGVSQQDTMRVLVTKEGIEPELAYLAIKAAALANRG